MCFKQLLGFHLLEFLLSITILLGGPSVSLLEKLNFLYIASLLIILRSLNLPPSHHRITIGRWGVFSPYPPLQQIFTEKNSAFGLQFLLRFLVKMSGKRWIITILRILINMKLPIIVSFNHGFRGVYQEIRGAWIHPPSWSRNEKLICFRYLG